MTNINAAETMQDRRPHIVLRPPRRWEALELSEIFRFRDLLLTLAGRDIKVRYKQTALGVTWVILQPLLAAGVFSFIFGKVADFDAPGMVPYFLFVFAGMTAWNVFSNTLGRSTVSMVGNAQLISKVYFPRVILPISAVFSSLVDFLVIFVVVVILNAVFWQFAWTIFLVPVAVFLLAGFAIAAGIITGALTVTYRDVNYIVPVMTQFLMWATPVAYPVTKIPEEYLGLYYLNPLVAVIETFKYGLFGVGNFDVGRLAYSAIFLVVLSVVGMVVFKRMERNFADVI